MQDPESTDPEEVKSHILSVWRSSCVIPEDPDYEQAKDTLHNACVPLADELWFFKDRVCVVYIRSLSVSHAWPYKQRTQEDEEALHIHVYEQIGRPNTGGGYAFLYRHYPMSTWRFLWVCGTLSRITEKEAIHFIGPASLAEMRSRTVRLKRQSEGT